jgi:glycosidase
MNRSALFHTVTSPWCVQVSLTHVQLKLRTGLEIRRVSLIYGDPHEGHKVNGVWGWKSHTEVMPCTGQGEHHAYWTITIEPPQKRLKYQFLVEDDHETLIYGERAFEAVDGPHEHFNFFFMPYLHESPIYQAPAWVKDTVWYQIFPDRFNREPKAKHWPTGPVTNATHYGGNLQGITAKLPYLAELGITGLYLTPIFASPTTHKYDTTDYFTIDPDFGTLDDLKHLVDTAHRLNIKVMLDAVFNHAGLHFEPWKFAKEDPHSEFRDWFKFTPDGYETFAYAKNMPKLNTTHPAVIDYFCRVGAYWIETCDIDGWRLDVANEIAMDFWRAFRKAVHTIKPVYILGEVWHDANPWLSGDAFDGVMNYFYTRIVMDFILTDSMSISTFRAKIDDFRNRYPHVVLPNQFNLFDSHDTARLVTQANGDLSRIKQLLALLLVSEGSPCLYYGTEIGMEGGNDPDCRRLMQFDPDPVNHELYQLIHTFIGLRKRYPQLANDGPWAWIDHPRLVLIQRRNLVLILNPTSETLPNPVVGETLYALHPTNALQARDIRLIKTHD